VGRRPGAREAPVYLNKTRRSAKLIFGSRRIAISIDNGAIDLQRCAYVLGFEPMLLIAQDKEDERHLSLNYQADNFSAIGINCKFIDNQEELDGLLRFCRSAFAQT
jgi:hypothetical protein